MYLYRLHLKPQRKSRLLLDPHYMHGFTMLPYDGKREDLDLLWTTTRVGDGRAIIVQTNRLIKTDAWKYHEEVLKVEGPLCSDALMDTLHPGSRVIIRLVASPSKQHEGKHMLLHNEEEQLAWLRRKVEGALEVVDVLVDDQGLRISKAKNMRLKRVEYQGLCVVKDPEQVKKLVQEGIGKGKTLGLGMLQVFPVA